MNSERYPTFKDKGFLINHAESIMDFYHPICIDKEIGGFFIILEMMGVFMTLVQGIW